MTSTTRTSRSPLASLTGLICFVLVLGGGSGLLHEWLGWLHFMGFVRFLIPGGHEIAGYAAMVVLGLAIGVAGDALDQRVHGQEAA